MERDWDSREHTSATAVHFFSHNLAASCSSVFPTSARCFRSHLGRYVSSRLPLDQTLSLLLLARLHQAESILSILHQTPRPCAISLILLLQTFAGFSLSLTAITALWCWCRRFTAQLRGSQMRAGQCWTMPSDDTGISYSSSGPLLRFAMR